MDITDPAFQLELVANIAAAASIVLAGRNSVHGWWLSIVGGVLFAFVFLQTRLYGAVALQGFFIVVSAFGWWQWLRGDHGAPLAITDVRRRTWWWLLPVVVLGWLLYGWVLGRHTDGRMPWLDALVVVLSMAAQLLMMRRKLQSWWLWLLVNTLAVPLYFRLELYVTALLYIGFWINALVALRHWRALLRRGERLDA